MIDRMVVPDGEAKGKARQRRAGGERGGSRCRPLALALLLWWPAASALAAGGPASCPAVAASAPGQVEHILRRAGPTVRRVLRRAEGGPLVPLGARRQTVSCTVFHRAMLHLPLARPVGHAHITSGFGIRVDPFTGHRAMHEGIDFEAPFGARVRATAPGRVVAAGFRGGYGRMVEVDHGNGVHTRYGHLSAILVHRGQQVAAGQPIGREGSSGRSTGPHVHYEIRVDHAAINPAPFLRAGVRLQRSDASAGGLGEGSGEWINR